MARPKGAENKHKPFRAALFRLLDETGKDPEKLDEIAVTIADAAAAGDMQAAALIRDTMDGKPAQAIVGSDEHPSVTGWKEWMEWLNPTYRDAMFRGSNSTAITQDESDFLKAWPTDDAAKQ